MSLFACSAKPDRTKRSRSLRAGFVLYQALRGAEASAANDIPHLVCFTVFSSRFRDYCSFLRKAPEENHIVIIPQTADFLNRTFPLRKKPVISGIYRKGIFRFAARCLTATLQPTGLQHDRYSLFLKPNQMAFILLQSYILYIPHAGIPSLQVPVCFSVPYCPPQ